MKGSHLGRLPAAIKWGTVLNQNKSGAHCFMCSLKNCKSCSMRSLWLFQFWGLNSQWSVFQNAKNMMRPQEDTACMRLMTCADESFLFRLLMSPKSLRLQLLVSPQGTSQNQFNETIKSFEVVELNKVTLTNYLWWQVKKKNSTVRQDFPVAVKFIRPLNDHAVPSPPTNSPG